MIIEKDKVVSIDYTLTDEQGEILDSSEGGEPLEYIHGYRNIIPGLEAALVGKKIGDSFKAAIEAKDAYGEHRKELVAEVAKAQFPSEAEITVGMQFEAESPDGNSVVTVTKIAQDMITVDANHPLAGEKLFFDVTVAGVRDATEEELKNGLSDACGCGCGGGDCGDCDSECSCEDNDSGKSCSGGCCSH